MLIIGLTGGIGSGKTTVGNAFKSLGVPVIDADQISRELVTPGSPLLDRIRSAFGDHVIDDGGRLRRAVLRQQIFAHPDQRRDLEGILHPAIRQRMLQRVTGVRGPYAVLVIPLLLETGQTDLVDRVLVVDTAETEQLRRVCERDGSSREEAQRILRSQCSRQQRLQAADDVIRNDEDLPALQRAVEGLHRRYLRLSGNQ